MASLVPQGYTLVGPVDMTLDFEDIANLFEVRAMNEGYMDETFKIDVKEILLDQDNKLVNINGNLLRLSAN